MDYKQLLLNKAQRVERIRKLSPYMPDTSGIYTWWRRNADGYFCFYVGQAKHLIQRNADHLDEYKSHLGKSIVKHGLATDKQDGWHLTFTTCKEEDLNDKERQMIDAMMKLGNVITYNTTGGGQDHKHDICEINRNSGKGYYDGVKAGYNRARKEIAKLFEKNLNASVNGSVTATKQKALDKFYEFIKGGQDNG